MQPMSSLGNLDLKMVFPLIEGLQIEIVDESGEMTTEDIAFTISKTLADVNWMDTILSINDTYKEPATFE